MSFLRALLDGNEREVIKLRRRVADINVLETEYEALSNEQLGARTAQFREELRPWVEKLDEAKAARLAAVEPGDQGIADGVVKSAYEELEGALNDLVPQAFAAAREASKRTLKLRHFDVQLAAGIALHEGRVSELATGEGKTLSATCPLYLNALAGKSVHLITPNDYLAKRDALWNAPIYHLLGLTIGVIQNFPYGAAYVYEPGLVADDPHMNELRPVHRRECYQCDLVCGTNAEFGFDYLRDNMAISFDQMVQRDLHYAIVDEMDSILIDEARTPLIISGMPEQVSDLYYRVDRVIARLQHERDFTLDEKAKNAMLNEDGTRRVEEGLAVGNLADDVSLMHHVSAALRARFAYKRDVDYVVKDNQVIIVDEFTGRLMHGRRYSDGLHQAIEAKEGVRVEEETQTVATITIQNYFRLYHKLAGMTGTAKTEETEIRKIYGMDVVVVPTNLPMIRKDQPDVVYKTDEQKFRALALEILQRHVKGQPQLVGTRSIETSERLSERLKIGERLQLQALILILRDRLLTSKSISKEQQEQFHALLNTKLDDLYIPKLTPVAKALDVPLDALHPSNLQALKSLLELDRIDDPGIREAVARVERVAGLTDSRGGRIEVDTAGLHELRRHGRERAQESADQVLINALTDGIPHAVLNAKYHEREAEIIAEAGRKHAVTIATNMAGRGVDIMLGGKPDPDAHWDEPTEVALTSGFTKTYPSREAAEVAQLGGLAIVGSERHESRRIDRQLRGRSGRQGDPGESRFYLSLEDELWRLFGNPTWQQRMLAGWPEYERLEARVLSAAIERAQRKVEEHNFGIRKHTLEYDDVMNVHRDVIYRQRREILAGADLRDTILDHTYDMIQDAVDRHCGAEVMPDEWDLRGLYDELDLLFDVSLHARPADLDGKAREALVEDLYALAEKQYEKKEAKLAADLAAYELDIRDVERQISLRVIDDKWVEHLNGMEYLREGVWMRGYEQRDPLVVYKKEAFEMFNALLDSIQDDMVERMFHLTVQRQESPLPRPRPRIIEPVPEDADGAGVGGNGARTPPVGSTARRAGRNDPCPCGSGKKYKFCCLKSGAA